MTQRRRPVGESELQVGIDEGDKAQPTTRTGNIESLTGKPFVQVPGAPGERARWSCANGDSDLVGGDNPEKRGEDAQVDSFPLEREEELTLERVGRSMTRRQQLPI